MCHKLSESEGVLLTSLLFHVGTFQSLSQVWLHSLLLKIMYPATLQFCLSCSGLGVVFCMYPQLMYSIILFFLYLTEEKRVHYIAEPFHFSVTHFTCLPLSILACDGKPRLWGRFTSWKSRGKFWVNNDQHWAWTHLWEKVVVMPLSHAKQSCIMFPFYWMSEFKLLWVMTLWGNLLECSVMKWFETVPSGIVTGFALMILGYHCPNIPFANFVYCIFVAKDLQ